MRLTVTLNVICLGTGYFGREFACLDVVPGKDNVQSGGDEVEIEKESTMEPEAYERSRYPPAYPPRPQSLRKLPLSATKKHIRRLHLRYRLLYLSFLPADKTRTPRYVRA